MVRKLGAPKSKKRPKTLVDQFYYPRLGAGMLWEKFEDYLNEHGILVKKNCNVTNVSENGEHHIVSYTQNNKDVTVSAEHILFSNPLLNFIKFYKDTVPEEVVEAAGKLEYRNHISVHVTVDKKLFDDNWIYIHSPGLKMARIADFTNFSSEMSKLNESLV